MMKQNITNSTALASVDYDAGRELLRIEFRDRTTYIYLGVPADVHDGLVCALSPGTYFNRVIRGQYCSLPAPIAAEKRWLLILALMGDRPRVGQSRREAGQARVVSCSHGTTNLHDQVSRLPYRERER